MICGLEQEGGSLIALMALAHPLHPIHNRSRNKRRNLWVGQCVSSWWPWFPSRSCVLIIYLCMCIPYIWVLLQDVYIYNGSVIQYWRSCTPSRSIGLYFWGVRSSWAECHFSFSLVYQLCLVLWYKSNTRMLVTFEICFKQHFDTRYLVLYNPSPPRMLLSLDLLWEYRIPHGANGPLYVTSSYSTWIFCRGVSGLSWINHLPPACWSTFWKSNFKQQLGCRFDRMDNKSYFFCVMTYAIIYVLKHQIIFRFYLLKYSLFFQVLLY